MFKASLLTLPFFTANGLNFKLLHINDMHARVQGMSGTGGCDPSDNDAANCDGGWARLVTAGKRIVEESDVPVVFVNNGDQFAGTVWSTFYQGAESYVFLNQLCSPVEEGGAGFAYCFSGIGNHEFDFGYEPLLNWARNLNHDIITSNIEDTCPQNSQFDFHAEAELGSYFNKQKTVEIDGTNVTFVGYTLTGTPGISSPPPCLEFQDEDDALGVQLTQIAETDVNVVIAIGHSGIERDLELAAQFPEVKVIVGGHSHTFLWDLENQGGYPAQSEVDVQEDGTVLPEFDTIASDDNVYPRFAEGSETPVLQAYFGGRYLGAIDLDFDDEGTLTSFTREAVILQNNASALAGVTVDPDTGALTDVDPSLAFGEDPATAAMVTEMFAPLAEFISTPVGVARTTLDVAIDGVRKIRTSEMPLGNVVCDAMYANIAGKTDGVVDLCMQNAGGIRAAFDEGQITFGDVITVHPFSNVLSLLEFTGERIHRAVEFGLQNSPSELGAFLHFSRGFQVVYDPLAEPLSRVINITLNGELIANDESRTYNVVTNNFIASGGDNYGEIFSGAPVIVESGDPQEDALAEYISAAENCPLCAEVEGRIVPTVAVVGDVQVSDFDFPVCADLPEVECDLSVEDDGEEDDSSANIMSAFASVIAVAMIALF